MVKKSTKIKQELLKQSISQGEETIDEQWVNLWIKINIKNENS